MKKVIAAVCFLISAFLLGRYMVCYPQLEHIAMLRGFLGESRELTAVVVFTLSAVAFFALLGWAILKCEREIKKSTVIKLQIDKEEK